MEGNLTGAKAEAVLQAESQSGESCDTAEEAAEAEELSKLRNSRGRSEDGIPQGKPPEEIPKEWSQERKPRGNEAPEANRKVGPRKGKHRKASQRSGAKRPDGSN